MSRFAIIPAKSRSTGIPGKNWKPLNGLSPTQRAIDVARQVGFDRIIVSSDDCPDLATDWDWLERPAELCADETPMIDVVRHAMEYTRLLIARNEAWTGRQNPEADDIFCILQPTQPLREPKHLLAAIALLESSGADSVVSVMEGPSPDKAMAMTDRGRLHPWKHQSDIERRQDARPAFWRDGTCYALRRATVDGGDLYGAWSQALVIPASESCPLDEIEDWSNAERLLREREAQADRSR